MRTASISESAGTVASSRHPAVRTALIALLVLLCSADHLAAQSAACAAPDCVLAPDQIHTATVRIAELEQEFAAGVNKLAVSLSAVAGDAGTIGAALESMEAVLARWDGAMRALETSQPPSRRTPDLHVALARAYAGRFRLDDALRELAEAARQDPRRADVLVLTGLAYALANKPAESAQALVNASVLEPDNPAAYYQLARQRRAMNQTAETRDALQMFGDRVEKHLARPLGRDTTATPFEGISRLAPADETAPVFPLVSYAPGFALVARGTYEEAIAWFRQAAASEAGASTPQSKSQLARGRAAVRDGDVAAALAAFSEAAASAPDRSEARRLLGAVYAADGQYDRSVDQFNAAVRVDSSDERAWTALADVLATVGRFADAEQVLNRAIQQMPASGQLHFSLGRLYRSLARYSDAAREFETAATLGPAAGQDVLFAALGETYVVQAAFDRAAAVWIRRLDLNPNDADAHRRLGQAYLRLDRDDEAIAEFLSALWIDPRSADAHSAIAQLHLRAGRYREAADAAARAVALDPELKEARYILGTALMQLGRAEEATKEIDEFRRLQAAAGVAAARTYKIERLRHDAAVSLASADYEKAAGLLREAVSLESDAASIYLALGFALLESGHHADAIVSLRKASELESLPDAHRYLAEAYNALGRLDESRSELETYRGMIRRLKIERLSQLGQAAR